MAEEEGIGAPGSGVPDGETPAGTGAPQQDPGPPWGDDFDPGRAWARIQAQKADLDKARADRDRFKTQADDAAKAKLSDLERVTAERDEARQAHGETQRELWAIRAAAKHGLDPEDTEYLQGGTEEELDASAQRFAQRHGGPGRSRPPVPFGRPVPKLDAAGQIRQPRPRKPTPGNSPRVFPVCNMCARP
jgi:hypothetical protein